MHAHDLLGLHHLYARYCHSIDLHDHEAIASCFTPEAVLRIVEQTPSGAPRETVIEGRDAIVGRLMTVSTGRPGFVHETFNVLVDESVEGPVVAGQANFRVMTPLCVPESMGRYADAATRSDASWAFSERTVEYAWRDTWTWLGQG